MKRIGLKYCGGCNPQIDRTALAVEIGSLLPPDCRLETVKPSHAYGVAVMICGCPTACADRPDIRGMARRWIRVAGNTIDCESLPPVELAARVIEIIDRAGMEDNSHPDSQPST